MRRAARRAHPARRRVRADSRGAARRRRPAAADAHRSAPSTDLIALARRKARHHHQDGAGARRAAGAFRGRPARNRLAAEAPKTFVHDLSRKLTAWTGKRWMVVVSREQGAPTMREQANSREAELKRDVRQRSAGRRPCSRNFPAPRSSTVDADARLKRRTACRPTGAMRTS